VNNSSEETGNYRSRSGKKYYITGQGKMAKLLKRSQPGKEVENIACTLQGKGEK
jgi:hypothetical protein